MKYTLEEVKEKTGCNYIVSHIKTKEGYEEITHSDGNKKLYSKGFEKQLTWWFKTRRKTKEGFEEIIYSNGNKKLYSKGFEKRIN